MIPLRTARFAAIAVLAMLAGKAEAAGTKNTSSDSFEIGLEGQYYQYREPLFAKLQGYGIGLDGTYTYNWNSWFLRANVIADFYNLNYSSDGTGSLDGIDDYKQDYRGMFGHSWKVGKGTTVSPYLGIGYRMLFDANGENISSAGAAGYNRRSQYLYAPIGVGLDFKAGNWGLRTYGEYDFLIRGWQTSYLRDLGFDNNIENNQTGGFGLRGAVMVDPPINFYHFSVGPYVRYWNIHESDLQTLYFGGAAIGTGQEPRNNTLEYGLEASVRFQ